MGALAACAMPALGGALATESFPLQTGPGVGPAALDEVVNTSTGLGTWGERGACGLQGNQSIYPSGSSYVTQPPSVVAMKFNIGSTIDTLNTTYGAGNWTISNPKITLQYTYYANNSNFGAGAGTFETYVIQNNSWYFSNNGTGGPGLFNGYTPGEDPIYAADPGTLATWSGGQADLGSTTYKWLSPPGVSVGPSTVNPNYSSWSTDKTGVNQGLLTDTLANDPLLVSDVTGATAAANANVSFYMIPNDATLGICIFTGGGTSEPTLNFEVDGVPEPSSIALAGLCAGAALLRRRRARC